MRTPHIENAGRYLVSTLNWLAGQMSDPRLRVYDCTMLQVPDATGTYRVRNMREAWAAGHIPGAGYIDLVEDFSDRDSRWRFMLPAVAHVAVAMSRLGISSDSRVVLYSTGNASWAARAWWVMQCAGFDGAVVLDGGYAKWKAEGRPVSTTPCAYPPARLTPHFRPELVCDKDTVLSAIGDTQRVIVNALTPEQHAGSGGIQYGRPGRIAGSVNVPWRDLTDAATGVFRPVASLRETFARAGVTPEREALVYCGGGIAAAAVFFALALAGHDKARLYDASLQEWAADATLPMERG